MGRIKLVAVKSLGDDLIRQHGDKFSSDFDRNKKALKETKEIKSKKIRNVLAGYITRKMKILKETDN